MAGVFDKADAEYEARMAALQAKRAGTRKVHVKVLAGTFYISDSQAQQTYEIDKEFTALLDEFNRYGVSDEEFEDKRAALATRAKIILTDKAATYPPPSVQMAQITKNTAETTLYNVPAGVVAAPKKVRFSARPDGEVSAGSLRILEDPFAEGARMWSSPRDILVFPVERDGIYVQLKETWLQVGGWSDGADLRDDREPANGLYDEAFKATREAARDKNAEVYDKRFTEWEDSLEDVLDEHRNSLRMRYIMQVGYAKGDFPCHFHAGSIYDPAGGMDQLVEINKMGFLSIGGQSSVGTEADKVEGLRKYADKNYVWSVKDTLAQRAYLEGFVPIELYRRLLENLDKSYTITATGHLPRVGEDGDHGEIISVGSIGLNQNPVMAWTQEGDVLYGPDPKTAEQWDKTHPYVCIYAAWRVTSLWTDVIAALKGQKTTPVRMAEPAKPVNFTPAQPASNLYHERAKLWTKAGETVTNPIEDDPMYKFMKLHWEKVGGWAGGNTREQKSAWLASMQPAERDFVISTEKQYYLQAAGSLNNDFPSIVADKFPLVTTNSDKDDFAAINRLGLIVINYNYAERGVTKMLFGFIPAEIIQLVWQNLHSTYAIQILGSTAETRSTFSGARDYLDEHPEKLKPWTNIPHEEYFDTKYPAIVIISAPHVTSILSNVRAALEGKRSEIVMMPAAQRVPYEALSAAEQMQVAEQDVFDAPPPYAPPPVPGVVRFVAPIDVAIAGGTPIAPRPVVFAAAAPAAAPAAARAAAVGGSFGQRMAALRATEKAAALAKARAYWAQHPRSEAMDKRRTGKLVYKAANYNPAKNDFPGIDTRAVGIKEGFAKRAPRASVSRRR